MNHPLQLTKEQAATLEQIVKDSDEILRSVVNDMYPKILGNEQLRANLCIGFTAGVAATLLWQARTDHSGAV
jgi:signal transduction histidine kinase